jgi:hypothetical protein
MGAKQLDSNWSEGEDEFWTEVREHVLAHKPDLLDQVEKLRQFVDAKLKADDPDAELFFHHTAVAVAETIERGGYEELSERIKGRFSDVPRKLAEKHPVLKRFVTGE